MPADRTKQVRIQRLMLLVLLLGGLLFVQILPGWEQPMKTHDAHKSNDSFDWLLAATMYHFHWVRLIAYVLLLWLMPKLSRAVARKIAPSVPQRQPRRPNLSSSSARPTKKTVAAPVKATARRPMTHPLPTAHGSTAGASTAKKAAAKKTTSASSTRTVKRTAPPTRTAKKTTPPPAKKTTTVPAARPAARQPMTHPLPTPSPTTPSPLQQIAHQEGLDRLNNATATFAVTLLELSARHPGVKEFEVALMSGSETRSLIISAEAGDREVAYWVENRVGGWLFCLGFRIEDDGSYSNICVGGPSRKNDKQIDSLDEVRMLSERVYTNMVHVIDELKHKYA